MTIKVTYNVTDVYMSQSVSPVYINVSYSAGGASGGGVWGSITGTLSNQTDLQTALDLKVPYSGATGNVNLGEYELKAGQVTLDTSPTGTAAVGTIRWNDTTGTSETTLKGGNVIIKNGVDLVARVVNKVTPNTTLTKAAYQAVKVSGAQGQRLAIELAQANNDAGSADTIGIVTETIAPNQEGFIMTVGQLEGINTTGSLQGETWVDGDVLYLSPTTAGAITNVKPTGATGHLVIIGYVEYAHVNNGKLYIKVANGFELDELHNVSIVTPTNNQGLFYNSSNSLWENKTIDTALGFTPANAATTLTINGVTYDLSTSRTWTIAAGISGSGASGQVTYWTGASAVSGSNNLFWDAANNRLGIGTNAPALRLSVIDNSSTNVASFRGSASSYILVGDASLAGESGVNCINSQAQGFFAVSGSQVVVAGASGANVIRFNLGGSERMRISPTFGLMIGTTTDLGTRLGVVGDTLLRGSGATSATTALTVQNSASATMMSISNDAANTILNISGSTNSSFQANQTTANRTAYFGSVGTDAQFGVGTAIATYTFINGGGFGLLRLNTNTLTTTGGNVMDLPVINTPFNPTSGSATLTLLQMRPNINQTGGANGVTRGLYVNPILTAAADFRAIETSAGNVLFGSNFFWNNTNGRLGIGIATPSVSLDVRTSAVGELAYFANTAANSGLIIGTQTNVGYISSVSSLSALGFGINGTTTAIRIFTNSNVSINNNVDLGVRFSVVGDTRLIGSGATSATTALTVQNSGSINMIQVLNNGYIRVGSTARFYSSSVASGGDVDLAGELFTINSRNFNTPTNQQNGDVLFNGVTILDTSGIHNGVSLSRSFTPTSGTSIFNHLALNTVINQTGGANGITRGLYVNPTLTSAADFRAIETTSGRIVFGNLPTSSAGLPTGALWNDAGTVKIV